MKHATRSISSMWLQPMDEFDPSQPAILHDVLNGVVMPWTGEEMVNFMRYAEYKDDGSVEWDGSVFDGWCEPPGK